MIQSANISSNIQLFDSLFLSRKLFDILGNPNRRACDAWYPDQSALSIRGHINGEQILSICEPIPVVQWFRHLPGVREVLRSIPAPATSELSANLPQFFSPQEFQRKNHPRGVRVKGQATLITGVLQMRL